MAEYDLYLKPEKCVFKQRTITYLGLVIGEGEIRMDPLKVEAVRTWPPVTARQAVRTTMVFWSRSCNKTMVATFTS